MRIYAEEIDLELAEGGIELTVGADEVCRVLRIDRRTLGRLLSSRMLRASRVTRKGSSRVLVRRREIARFIADLESAEGADLKGTA